jgi:catechol 2,3-dioxygenase-like lactoylglutathione lyase family enzyme
MPLTKMEHFLVLTADLDATRDFYCRVLGMREGPRPPLGFPGYWLYLGDTPVIHIAEWKTYTDHSNGRDIPVSTPAPGTGALGELRGLEQDVKRGRHGTFARGGDRLVHRSLLGRECLRGKK